MDTQREERVGLHGHRSPKVEDIARSRSRQRSSVGRVARET